MNPDLEKIPDQDELNKFYDKIDLRSNPPRNGDKLIFKRGNNPNFIKILHTEVLQNTRNIRNTLSFKNADLKITLKIRLDPINSIDMSFFESSFDEGTGQSLYKFNPEKWLASNPTKQLVYINQTALNNQLDTGNLMDVDEYIYGKKHSSNNDKTDAEAVGLYKEFFGLDKSRKGGKRKSGKSKKSKKSRKSRKHKK
jgi:hypothetical protein